MSSLQKDPSGNYHICFRFQNRRFKRSLKTSNEKKAEASVVKLDERVWMIRNGHLQMPAGVEVGTFLIRGDSQRQVVPSEKPSTKKSPRKPVLLTLAKLFDEYFQTARNGSLEPSTILTLEVHRRHLERQLGKTFSCNEMSPRDLQRYINQRSKMKGKYGRQICGSTIRKELVTLRTVWNWGRELKLVSGKLSLRKIQFPKNVEMAPFQTRAQIKQRIIKGKLSKTAVKEIWEALFLVKHEVSDVLIQIRDKAKVPFLYPMVCVAAHCGVRRSELLRMQVADIHGSRLLVRERKRVRGQISTRFVPLTRALQEVLSEWLKVHSGGEHLFVDEVGKAITKDVAHNRLKSTLKTTTWDCIKGYHVFRHSFISALAMEGVDQRVIDEIVGHTTEQQRRRYRHLTPDITANAVESVFGGS